MCFFIPIPTFDFSFGLIDSFSTMTMSSFSSKSCLETTEEDSMSVLTIICGGSSLESWWTGLDWREGGGKGILEGGMREGSLSKTGSSRRENFPSSSPYVDSLADLPASERGGGASL